MRTRFFGSATGSATDAHIRSCELAEKHTSPIRTGVTRRLPQLQQVFAEPRRPCRRRQRRAPIHCKELLLPDPSPKRRAQDFACGLSAAEQRGLAPTKRIKLVVPGNTALFIPDCDRRMAPGQAFDVDWLSKWQQNHGVHQADDRCEIKDKQAESLLRV